MNTQPINLGNGWVEGARQKFAQGFTTMNTLGAAYAVNPEIDNVINYLYGQKYTLGGLTRWLGSGAREFLDGSASTLGSGEVGRYQYEVRNRRIIWYIQGVLDEPVFVVVPPVINTWLNNNTFQITVDKKFLNEQDVVRFPSGANAYVVSEGVSNGANQYTYNMRLTLKNGILNANMDVVKGAELRIGSTMAGELSETGFSNQFMPELRDGVMGLKRRSYSMSGHANHSFVYFSPYQKGKKEYAAKDCIWMHKQEKEFMIQMGRDTEYGYWYDDRTTDVNGISHVFDKRGNPIVQGDGVLNQIKFAVQRQYQPGIRNDYDFYSSILTDALKNSPETMNKTVLCFTGMGGITQFNSDMRGFLLSSNIQNTMDIFARKVKSQNQNDSYGIGGNFSEFNGLFGCRFILVHNWAFDSSTFNGAKHPVTGFNMESHRMVFLDASEFGGKPNVQLLKVKGNGGQDRGFVRKVSPGMDTPVGEDYNFAVNGTDGFTVHILQESGIIVRQPYSSVDLQASIAS